MRNAIFTCFCRYVYILAHNENCLSLTVSLDEEKRLIGGTVESNQ